MSSITADTLDFAPDRPGGTPARKGFGFELSAIHKSFGAQEVLKDLDLIVPAGQFLAIVGKSGCGKSTLLRIVAGLERPTGGQFNLASGGTSPVRIMFQEPRLLPWARLAENVAVGLTGIAGGGEARTRALGLLDEVGLLNRADEWPSILSGGQKQRVALARALVSQPGILALDEPLGALDALTRIEMQQLIERIWLHERFTAVLVTHDVSEAVSLADRVVVIAEGRIALDETVDLPRPRRRGAAALAALEGRILDRLLANSR